MINSHGRRRIPDLVFSATSLLALASGFALSRLDPPEWRWASPTLAAGTSAPRIHFPTLSPDPSASSECGVEIAIMSLGPEPSQAIIARFSQASESGCAGCAGPISIQCTGLLRPGRAWRLLLAPGEASGSAVVVSLSADPLESIVPGGGPAPIAAVVCAALQSAMADPPADPSSRCTEWGHFEAAWAEGTDYAGVPLGLAIGAALGGQATTACPAGIAALPAVAAFDAAGEHALPRLDPADHVVIQNAGAECVSVTLMARAFSACGSFSPCATIELAPGEARTIASRTCGPFGAGGGASPGTGLIVADGPVAVAIARSDGAGTNLTEAPTATSHRLAAPLAFDPEQGWTTSVDVKTFAESPGDVAVTVDFLDGDGRVAARVERRLCAGSAQTFERSATTALPGLETGSVRVSAVHVGGSAGPARIAATIRLIHAADAGPGEEPGAGGASAAYSLAAMEPAGVGVLGLPSLSKRSETDDGSSAIALANIAAAGVETEYALMLFDPSGLIDTACGTLDAGAVDYIDLDRWTSIPAGFRGSAVISATRWRHAGPADPIDTAPVRLAAVIARWAGAAAGEDRLALSTSVDLPLGSDLAIKFAASLPPMPCEPGVPIPGTTATNTPRATQTRTPRPPSTATMPAPEDSYLWLPLTLRAWPLREASATPSPSSTPEPSPEASGTAESTMTPSPDPSSTAE